MPYKDKDVRRAYMKEWKRKRRIDNPEYAKSENQKWRDVNPRGYILSRARGRAKHEGIPFSITEDDIVLPEFCPVFPDLKLEFATGRVRPDNTPSLDKIVPELGYVPGNVQVISMRANRLKSDATVEELEAILSYMKGN